MLHLLFCFVAAAVEPVCEAGRSRDAGMRRAGVPGSGEGPVVPQRGGNLHVTRLHHLVLGRRVDPRDRRGVPRGRWHLPLYDHRQRRAEQHQHASTRRWSVLRGSVASGVLAPKRGASARGRRFSSRFRLTTPSKLFTSVYSVIKEYKARFPFKRNRLRCVRCVNENRKKRKRLRWQAANLGCHCFDRAFLLAGACVCCVKITQALAFLAVFVYATHATQAITFEWKPGLILHPGESR